MENERKKQMVELDILAVPLVKFLQENGNPHQTIVITSESIKLVSDEYSIPVNLVE